MLIHPLYPRVIKEKLGIIPTPFFLRSFPRDPALILRLHHPTTLACEDYVDITGVNDSD